MRPIWPPKGKEEFNVESWSPKVAPSSRIDLVFDTDLELDLAIRGPYPTSPAAEFLFEGKINECMDALHLVREANDADRLTRIYITHRFTADRLLKIRARKHKPLGEMSILWQTFYRLSVGEDIDFAGPDGVYADLASVDDYLLKSRQFDPISRMAAYYFAVHYWDFETREKYRSDLSVLHPSLQYALLCMDNSQSRWRSFLSDEAIESNQAIQSMLLWTNPDEVGPERKTEWARNLYVPFVPARVLCEALGLPWNLLGKFKYMRYWWKNGRGSEITYWK